MRIIDVLDRVQTTINFDAIPEFTKEDIDVLSSKDELTSLKWQTLSDDFKVSQSLAECTSRLLYEDEGNYLRLLEYCVFRNRVLKKDVEEVFQCLRR